MGNKNEMPGDQSAGSYTFRAQVEIADPALRAQGWEDGEYAFFGADEYFYPQWHNSQNEPVPENAGTETRLVALDPEARQLLYNDFKLPLLVTIPPYTR